MASEPEHEPGVAHEPHLRSRPSVRPADPSEALADQVLERERRKRTRREVVDDSVWDEPALAAELSGPATGDTYARFIADKRQATTWARSLRVTLWAAALAGPLAVFGVLIDGLAGAGSLSSIFQPLLIVVLGPAAEEVMKVAVPLMLLERHPYLFQRGWQLVACGVIGGLAFAAIENVLYLYVYVPDPPEALVTWRWTVCVILHTGCSTIAGFGLRRMWLRAGRTVTRPKPSDALAYIMLAAVLHGTYNGLALAFSVFESTF